MIHELVNLKKKQNESIILHRHNNNDVFSSRVIKKNSDEWYEMRTFCEVSGNKDESATGIFFCMKMSAFSSCVGFSGPI